MRRQDYFGRDTLRDQIGPAVFLLNSRIDMLPEVGIGPAVEATRLEAGEEVGHHHVRRIVALFHRRPQLSCTRIKAKADRVAKSSRDHLMARAVRIVAMNGRAHFRVACDQIGRRANSQIHLARALIE